MESGTEGTVALLIRNKLELALKPRRLDIAHDSHLHAGHAGASVDGESHFRLVVVAAAFEGLSRVDRQRLVYEILADELAGPVHALSLSAITPQQDSTES